MSEAIQSAYFVINNSNSTYDPVTKTWSVDLPTFFTNSRSSEKMISIDLFHYFKGDGTLDIGTSFHSPTLLDGNYQQMDYFVTISLFGSAIGRRYKITSHPQKIIFFMRDYNNSDNLEMNESDRFFIQTELFY